MQINPQNRVWTVDAVGRAPEVERAAEAEAARQYADAVKVSVSERARALSTQKPVAPSAEGFDAAKVERLRAQIADGSFRVDPDAIAQKLLDEV
jgi:negative regulator of flagellin synthesis FlgM